MYGGGGGGGSGGARVLGKLPVPGPPTIWMIVGQGPIALAVGADGGCLVGCFGFNGPLRHYFSLYRAVSQKEERKRRERIEESTNVQTTPTRTYCKRNRPLPYYHPNCRTPRHWKFTQDHRTTRPPPGLFGQFYSLLSSSSLSLGDGPI